MGNIQWSSPKRVKNGSLIFLSAPFPESKKAQETIWNLWKLKKINLKADGFGLGKDNGQWKIKYFHTINENSDEKTTSGLPMWRAELDKKIQKWGSVLNQVRDFVNEKTESDVLNETNENDSEEEDENSNSKIKQKNYKCIEQKNNSPPEIVLEYEGNDDDDLAELNKMLNKFKAQN